MSLRVLIAGVVFLMGCWEPISAEENQSPAPGKQVQQTHQTEDGKSISYLLYLPENYLSGNESLPLMLFLHGRGESYGPLSLVAKWGPPMMAARGDQQPYILVSPQCPAEDSWKNETQQALLVDLLETIVEEYNVDENRVYLTGLSMGGYGSWRMAADHPDRFAAVVPVCGGGDPADAEKLRDVPIWVFHGDRDRAVAFDKSVEMVDAIKAAGGDKIRFTTLENIGHNCWSATYATPDLYEWLKRQQRGE